MNRAKLYVLDDGAGRIKIGSSNDPRRRRLQLGDHLRLVETREHVEAVMLEGMAQRLLAMAGKRVPRKRDWFYASLEDARIAVDRAERILAGAEPEPIYCHSPTGKTIHYSMRMDGEVHARAERMAEAERRSLANWIEGLIVAALESREHAGDGDKRSARR